MLLVLLSQASITFGQVGIGVSNPQYMMDLRGVLRLRYDSANSLPAALYWNKPDNSLAMRMEMPSDTTMVWNVVLPFSPTGSPRRAFVWDHSRSYLGLQRESSTAGLGTPELMRPSAALHVRNTDSIGLFLDYKVSIVAPTGSGSGIAFGNNNSYSGAIRNLREGSSLGSLRFYVGSNASLSGLREALTLLPNGFVGINRTNPSYPLQVTHNDSAVSLIENTTEMLAGVKVQQLYKTGDFFTAATGTRATGSNVSSFFISTFAGTAASVLRERLTITDNGNVGIGVTDPSAQLDVSGTLRFRNGAASGALLTSDANGNATWQVPVSSPTRALSASIFPAISINANQIRTLRFGNTTFSEGLSINDSLITIPVSGVYQFTLNFGFISVTSLDGGSDRTITFSIDPSTSSSQNLIAQGRSASTSSITYNGSATLRLVAGETVKITCFTPANQNVSLSNVGFLNDLYVHLIK